MGFGDVLRLFHAGPKQEKREVLIDLPLLDRRDTDGVPIRYEGELIGAVGVSGKSNMDEYRAIAEAAVAAILDALDAN